MSEETSEQVRTALEIKIIRACRGTLHDNKVPRIATLAEGSDTASAFAKALAAQFPGLGDEQRAAILECCATECGWQS